MDETKLLNNKVILEIKTSRTTEETPESMAQFLLGLVNLKKRLMFVYPMGIPISLEIGVFNQSIHLYICVSEEYQTFIESQLVSQYPKAIMTRIKDYMPEVLNAPGKLYQGRIKLKHSSMFPIKTYKDFKDIDPFSSILGLLAKIDPNDKVIIQLILVPIGTGWQSRGQNAITKEKEPNSFSNSANTYKKFISEKIAHNGFKVGIKLVVKTENPFLYTNLAGAFSIYNNPNGNSLFVRRPYLWQKQRFQKSLLSRSRSFIPSDQILNVYEIASLFHFPTEQLSSIHNLSWTKSIFSEPPESLPVAFGLSDDEKKDINFFANTVYKNKPTNFGIKKKDRRKHMYIVGKTGAGKSTLIANMIINDIRNGEGVAIIDPHGDLADTVLDYIPSYRVNDVIYLNPSDTVSSFVLNPLEIGGAQKELVASGIVSIFKKLYGTSWGPRLEYILRNSILTLLEIPNSTFLDVPQLLTNKGFRTRILEKIHDPVLKNYWIDEFEAMQPRLMSESISPILNKVGQFISSHMVRNIIGYPKSTIDLEKIMNERKILILNLSQGKLGEDNSSLLGAMIITKIQLAAMNRVNITEEDRKDFYLYVDEFQNFATNSFIKILSEARKYRLNLIMANQYMAQVPEEIKAAIFGNIGTLLTFIVGASDAFSLAKEFGERFKENDLLSLGNYQIISKLSIDGITTAPFLAQTLPLPLSVTQNREKSIKASHERYSAKSHHAPAPNQDFTSSIGSLESPVPDIE